MGGDTATIGQRDIERARRAIDARCLVFVGMMGSGKSVIGRLTAEALSMPFVDCDSEIETVSQMSIDDLFKTYGEAEFRALEARVMNRLLQSGAKVISTGGGAFVQPRTRAAIKARGLSVWLKADLEVLWERVQKRNTRPLLKTANPKDTLKALLEVRAPAYAMADITVQSRNVAKQTVVAQVIAAIANTYRKDSLS